MNGINSPERAALIKKILDSYCKYLLRLSNDDLAFMIETKGRNVTEAHYRQIAWRAKSEKGATAPINVPLKVEKTETLYA